MILLKNTKQRTKKTKTNKRQTYIWPVPWYNMLNLLLVPIQAPVWAPAALHFLIFLILIYIPWKGTYTKKRYREKDPLATGSLPK